MSTTYICPPCGEPVRHRPPTGLWPAGNGPRPQWSHLDGQPLCPVMGPRGYQPAQPAPAKTQQRRGRGR